MKGVDDLDFFIGDESIDKPNYATKVIISLSKYNGYCISLLFKDTVDCRHCTVYIGMFISIFVVCNHKRKY